MLLPRCPASSVLRPSGQEPFPRHVSARKQGVHALGRVLRVIAQTDPFLAPKVAVLQTFQRRGDHALLQTSGKDGRQGHSDSARRNREQLVDDGSNSGQARRGRIGGERGVRVAASILDALRLHPVASTPAQLLFFAGPSHSPDYSDNNPSLARGASASRQRSILLNQTAICERLAIVIPGEEGVSPGG